MSPRSCTPWLWIWLGLLCLLGSIATGCAAPTAPPRAVDGVLDLRAWDFEADGPATLAGEWELAWGELLEPASFDAAEAIAYEVPGPWNELEVGGAKLGERGVATVRLVVLLPRDHPAMLIRARGIATAHRLWIDGDERRGAGFVSASPERAVPDSPNRLHHVPASVERLEIVAQIANWDHPRAGLRKAWVLGDYVDVNRRHAGRMLYETVALTAMAVVGLAFLLFYAVRRTGIFRLYFGLFCLAYAARTGVSGDGLPLTEIWPGLDWAWRISLEHASSWAATALGLLTIASLYREQDVPAVSRGLVVFGAAGMLLTLASPPRAFMATVAILQLFAALALIWGLVILVRARRAKREGATGLLIALAVFLLALLHDIARARGLAPTPIELTQPAFIGVVLMEAAQLARSFARSYAVIEQLSKDLTVTNRDLEATNKAVERFVPYEFLHLLDRNSIRDVDRGDNADQVMDVLFCDLRSFTTIIESLEPKQAFAFINDYLSYMEPQIRKHKGFVNSYLGDAYLALYYGGGDETLRSAIAMMRSLEQFNRNQTHVPDMEIRVGIGIHSGSLMLGTIGGLDRLDSGVVGDPVNLASRVEGMTKMYGTPVLISEATYDRIERKRGFRIREIDRVVAKGKTEAIGIYEVVDGLPEALAERRWATREAFAAALALYRAGRFADAAKAFRAHLDEVPEDAPARALMQRCEDYADDPPADWDGVAVLTTK